MSTRARGIDGGWEPTYDWGNQPWPGTEYSGDDKPRPDVWFREGDFDALMARLRSRRNELQNVKKHLQDAGNIQAKDFGLWASAVQLFNDAKGAQSLMLGAVENWLVALDKTIDKLDTTKKTKLDGEAQNYEVVNIQNVQTIDLGQSAHPLPPQPPTQPGQPAQPGQPVKPGGY